MARKNNKSEITDTYTDERKDSKKSFLSKLGSKIFGFFTRPFFLVINPVNKLVKTQIGFILQDLKQDLGRKFVGLLFILVGFLFIYSFFLLLSALIIVALYEFAKIKLFYSILIVIGLHLLLVIIFILIGKAIFSKPMLSGNYNHDNKD